MKQEHQNLKSSINDLHFRVYLEKKKLHKNSENYGVPTDSKIAARRDQKYPKFSVNFWFLSFVNSPEFTILAKTNLLDDTEVVYIKARP